jgi:hypothetical protein
MLTFGGVPIGVAVAKDPVFTKTIGEAEAECVGKVSVYPLDGCPVSQAGVILITSKLGNRIYDVQLCSNCGIQECAKHMALASCGVAGEMSVKRKMCRLASILRGRTSVSLIQARMDQR